MSVEDDAMLIVQAVHMALKNGVRHWDVNGRELKTIVEVLEALKRDGEVTFDEPATLRLHP
jgi:hypothetical protein